MRIYVQGRSALAHYRSPEARLDIERVPRRICALEDATASIVQIREMRTYRLGIGDIDVNHPLDVLVPTRAKRGHSRSVRPRVWSTPIRGNAFRCVDREQYVSSPEFMFLQLATELSLVELIEVGMELCGTYRRSVPLAHLGSGEMECVTLYNMPVLTTPRRIEGFLNAMPKAPGIRAAKKALSYILPISASPLETAVYLLLCLPRSLGGYGLPKPVLNPPISFSKSGRRYTLRRSAKPDLLWKHVKLDVECNGEENHGENQRPADSMRRKALERMKYEVIELTKEEIYNVVIFHAVALRIAHKLGKQMRPEHERNFEEKRAKLRSQLLFDDAGKSWTWQGDESGQSEDDTASQLGDLIDEDGQIWTADALGIDLPAEDEVWDVALSESLEQVVEFRSEDAGFEDQLDPEVFDDEGLYVFGGRRAV